VSKNGGKKRVKQFLQKQTNNASKKCWEKIVEKSAKKLFLNSQEYRDKEMGGKKRAKQFFQKLANSASKKCCEKIVGKKGKKAIFIFARIS